MIHAREKPSSWPQRWHEKAARGGKLMAMGLGREWASSATGITTVTEGADMLLLHPAMGKALPGDHAGLLLALAQPGNANEEAEALYLSLPEARKALPLALGVCATDPFLLRETALRRWHEAGVQGLVNLPTVGALDGLYRQDLEASGMGYAREVELLALAKTLGFFTLALAFSAQEAEQMARAEADALILHLGWDSGPASDPGPSPKAPRARGLASHLREWRLLEAGARKGRADVLLLLAGDALQSPEDKAAVEQSLAAPDGLLTGFPLEGII